RSPWLAFVGWRPGPQISRRYVGHVGQYGQRQGSAAMSHAQINVKLVEIGLQFGIGEAVDDAAMFHHVIAVRNGRCEAKILLDQENGEALLLERPDGPADLLDDDRGEPLGRLVEQEEACAGAQDAADRQHLLLAAGELGALAREPLLEVGKELEDALERQPALAHPRRQQEIFLDAEAREDAALLGTQRDA